MKRKLLQIGNLTASVPLIQGGMGIGISLGRLAGAVAKEGGVGIISAAQIGFQEPDFAKDPLAANLRAMEQELKKARAIAPKGIIGFNIMVAMRNYEAYVKRAVEIGADLIVSGAGIPSKLPFYVGNSDIKLAPIVSTQKSAAVILRYWEKKYKRLPDLLVVEGPAAGGHLGFHLEELEYYQPSVYEEECRKILQTAADFGTRFGRKIPVAAAGGIDTPQAAAHMFEIGFDGIQVASRFVTTEECDAHIRYKESYLQACREDIVIVKSPVGMPGRAIANDFIRQVEAGKRFPPKKCYQCLQHCNPAEIPYCITEALVQAARGNVHEGLLFCGRNAYRAEKIETVKEVIENLLPECV